MKLNKGLDKYLSLLEDHHLTKIINLCNNNITFNTFINYCLKLNVTLFIKRNNKNIPKKLDELLEKLKELKIAYIKSFGLKIVKEYSEKEDSIELIYDNLKKIENKIEMIEYLIMIIETDYFNGKLYDLLNSTPETSIIEYISLDDNLFISSEEYSDTLLNCNIELELSINEDEDNGKIYIAEYSN